MLRLIIATPEKQIYDGEVNKIVAPTKDGEIGILPHHINLMTSLAPGSLHITQGSKVTIMALGEGLLQVDQNKVSILTDLAKEASDIDEKVVQEAHQRAKKALEEQTLSDEEYATTMAIIDKSLAQLKVKRHHHSRAQ